MLELKNINLYVYPMVPVERMGSQNSYVHDLSRALGQFVDVTNYNDFSNYGILNAFRYLWKADLFYFNWLENIPHLRFGKFQFFFACMLLGILKILGKKIVWTMHNKTPHAEDSRLSNFIFNFLARHSNIVVIHSSESKQILNDRQSNSQVFYYFHPIKWEGGSHGQRISEPAFDILIWGTMAPYKGVLEFLEGQAENLSDFKIKIIGKFLNTDYFGKVNAFKSVNISIENRFINDHEIGQLHRQARFILFPYLDQSVLNSGALVKSLCYMNRIIAPNFGAFADLSNLGLVLTYNSTNDLKQILDAEDLVFDTKLIEQFCKQNSWDSFAFELTEKMKSLFI